jgi:DNA-binding transcriptional LysR family regulator
VDNRDRIIERLKQNQDDLYIMTRPPQDLSLCIEPFLPNPLVVVAPADHPLIGKGPLKLADLQNERFILREPGSGSRFAIEEQLAHWGVQLRIQFELSSNEAIKQSVAAGLGLSILSRWSLADGGPPLVELPVEGFPIATQWLLVHQNGKQLSPATRAFLAEALASREELTQQILAHAR